MRHIGPNPNPNRYPEVLFQPYFRKGILQSEIGREDIRPLHARIGAQGEILECLFPRTLPGEVWTPALFQSFLSVKNSKKANQGDWVGRFALKEWNVATCDFLAHFNPFIWSKMERLGVKKVKKSLKELSIEDTQRLLKHFETCEDLVPLVLPLSFGEFGVLQSLLLAKFYNPSWVWLETENEIIASGFFGFLKNNVFEKFFQNFRFFQSQVEAWMPIATTSPNLRITNQELRWLLYGFLQETAYKLSATSLSGVAFESIRDKDQWGNEKSIPITIKELKWSF